MGAVGRSVARLIMRQVGRIEGVKRHPHRFRPVADQRSQSIQLVRLGNGHIPSPPVAGYPTARGADQLRRALPDQRTDARRLAFQIERGAQAANDGVGAQRSQRRTGHVEDHQKHKACHSKSNPRRPEPALNGAHETAAAFLAPARPTSPSRKSRMKTKRPASQPSSGPRLWVNK